VVVEQGIKGREIECAVLGNDFPQASTCGEVVLNSDFYSYDTKYIDDKGAQVVVPADIDPAINDKIRAIAIQRLSDARLLRHGARGCVPDAGKRSGDQ
jgi:D-alanine-D-alanine ligase